MIVRTLDQIIGGPKDVHGNGWRSRRLLTKTDAMGFSFHDTVLSEAASRNWNTSTISKPTTASAAKAKW